MRRHAPLGRVPLLLCVVVLLVFAVPTLERSQLTIHLTTDRATYEPGQPIQFELVLRNDGPEDVVLEFTSGQRYDFEIRNANDEVVWRWSDGMGFVQMLGREVLEPGEERRYAERFEGALASGTYQVVGRISARDTDLRSVAQIVIGD